MSKKALQFRYVDRPKIGRRYTVINPKDRTYLIDKDGRIKWTTSEEVARSWAREINETVVDADSFAAEPEKVFRDKYCWISYTPLFNNWM